MKVRLKKLCFIDSRLMAVGAEIEIRADLFSAACMEQLDGEPAGILADHPHESVVDPIGHGLVKVPAEQRRRGRPPKQRVE